MKLKRQEITIDGYSGPKKVQAILVGERVAVHQGVHGEGWVISDPVTGRAYSWDRFSNERASLEKARKFVRKFGTNPLKGSIFNSETDTFTRKAKHHDAIKAFFYPVLK